MDSLDLSDLMDRVALRDRRAFAELYRRTGAKLFGVCLRILNNRTDAEETLQEAYVKIWRSAASFDRDKGSPIAWMVTVARYQAIDVARARQPEADDIDETFDIADPQPDPEREAIASGERRRIDDCLGELEVDRASAVQAAYLEGASYQELATRFEVPLNTMRTWLRRALLRLRECLER